jgi:S1-C subfamily serine protease
MAVEALPLDDQRVPAQMAVLSGGGPAATAGLVPGDVITAAAGKAVSGPTDIQSIILAHKPGDKVSITYADANGQSLTATITLATGPPQ